MYDPEEVLGGYDGLIQIINDNVAFLSSKGVTAATVKAPLAANRALIFSDKTDRDNKKTALTIAQNKFEQDADAVYTALSDAVSLLAGVFGKKTPEGKQILALRTGVIGKKRKKHSPSSSSSSSSSS